MRRFSTRRYDGLGRAIAAQPARSFSIAKAVATAVAVALAAALALATGCAGAREAQPAPEDIVVMMSSGFAPVPTGDTPAPAQGEEGWTLRRWALPEGRPLFGWYAISSVAPGPRRFRLVAFVDYGQVQLDASGVASLTQDVTAPPNARIQQLMRVDGVTAGRHELMTVLFADPSDDDVDAPNGIEYDNEGFIAQRMMLESGTSDALARLPAAAGVTTTGNAAGFEGVALNESPDSPERVAQIDAEAGAPVALWAHFGNATDEPLEIAVVGLLDHVQVELDASATRAVQLTVPPRAIAALPLRLTAPASAGRHQLVVLRGAAPMREREDAPLVQDGVAASMRVALVVR